MEFREKPFPRGGSKPALHKSYKSPSFSFFGKSKTKKGIKKRKNKQSKDIDNVPKTFSNKKNLSGIKFVEDLHSKIIHEGMLLLGIVSGISEKIVSVSLPGSIRGVVTIPYISEFYKDMIKNSPYNSEILGLNDLFSMGDILPVKVLSVSDKNKSLILTSDPKTINSKLTYDIIENGFILCGNVKSKEDHGYIIDFGIEKTHGFLNFNKVYEGKELKVGKIIRAVIIKCNKSPGSCSVQVSTLWKDLHTAHLDSNSSLPVNLFLPGFQFEVSVKKVLLNGIEVSGMKENFPIGYIHKDHLLKKFPNLSQINIGHRNIVTLLYIKPLVNILYFKILSKKELIFPFQYGEIVSGKVVETRRSGVMVKVIKESKKAKCFIPISKLRNAHKLLSDKSKAESLYPVGKKLHKIRLGAINYMSRFYLGANDKASLEEKYFSVNDLKCGEIVPGRIASFGKNVAHIKIGKTITGIVAFSDMTDVPTRNIMSKFKVGQKIKARVVDVFLPTKFVRLTMKPTLLKEKKILCQPTFEKNQHYMGVIYKVLNNKLFVRFFNTIIGIVPKHQTPHPDSDSLQEYYSVGQLVKCSVLKVNKSKQLILSLFTYKSEINLLVGNKYKVVVGNISEKGLLVNVHVDKKKQCSGYIPKQLLSINQDLSAALLSTYSVGEKLFAYCLSSHTVNGLPIFGVLEVFNKFYKQIPQIEVDSVFPFLYKRRNSLTNKIFLMNLIPGKSNHMIKVVKDDFFNNSDLHSTASLDKYQLLYGKVLSIAGNKINVSIKLIDVWSKDFHNSLEVLDYYLKEVDNLIMRQKKVANAYSERARLGCFVEGVIEEVRSRHAIIKTDDNDLALVEGKFAVGQRVKGTIVWIDGTQQMIHVVANFGPNNVSGDIEEVYEPKWDKVHGKVVFVNEKVVVAQLRGRPAKGKLAYMPRKRHFNDLEISESPYALGDELSLRITVKSSKHLLAVDARIVAIQEKIICNDSQKKLKDSIISLKRKLETEKIERNKRRKRESESDELEVVEAKVTKKTENGGSSDILPEIKQEINEDDGLFNNTCNSTPHLEYDDIDIKSEVEEDVSKNELPSKSLLGSKVSNAEKIALSSSSESDDEESNGTQARNAEAFKVGFRWEVMQNSALLSGIVLNKDEPSSEDEVEESNNEKKKKRRLTVAERWEKSKTEEERLRLIEERLMDPDREPETVDDFDRAVLANPDSSALWLKYMAFHVQGTEIEAARTVARRALKAISFREEQEKLNVWIAMLNLENLYGTEDSLNKTLGEALQYNEPYNIHIHMLNLYGRNNKLQDMEKLGNLMLKKYKDNENMWCDVASAYFTVGKVESARNVLQRAMTVVNKKQHILLVSKFAHLENKFGSPERAQTLYESILASFPKRVDIWSRYVDMLVKSKLFDLARQVLERAISQSLRPRKMKTLFKKFLTFEETHGTPENVEKVREAAVEYVQTVGGKLDS